MTENAATTLTATGLIKRYGEATVLRGVDFSLRAGTVVGLIGENGAGKSTLSSIIAGIKQPDGGTMTIDGVAYAPSGPLEALNSGVAIIHQEIKMIPELSVAENMFLGRVPTRRGRVDYAAMKAQAAEVLAQLGVRLDPRTLVGGLSTATQQEIEIARAILREPSFVIFDEPSASLGQEETERVLEQIDLLRSRGTGVVYISHRLDEVSTISDRVVCLRDGAKVGDWAADEIDRDGMIRAMVGRSLDRRAIEPEPHGPTVVAKVTGLCSEHFDNVSFELHEGEILGLSGLVGAGRTEIVRALAGADPFRSGEVQVRGRRVRIRRMSDAIAAGIYMVPEDRKTQGLNLNRSSAENIATPWESRLVKGGFVTRRFLNRLKTRMADELDIRGDLDKPVGLLSGGNQQKVLLGKWLVRTPTVLILDEPTRGVDVGAKEAIYEIIRGLAAQGVAVIVVSSELEEVLLLSHRVMVVAGGRARDVLDRDQATPERIMQLSVPS
ncbi:sugar ABC transporter ATP-binding protein [Subtercola lobariae]|uniref:Sugar ABC transporter n=1 Tax=Subtercola lobariae TaxID=1588641 RepID=A0A917BCY8_9MICO|nr:sugar ABC transporter ATP-binding protein [Subtercola lobariae]GGF36261.1 sugar ABC transporter [Subtercola lobariae]